MSHHLILIYFICFIYFLKAQVVKVQASNVLESLLPATNYVWEILDKDSPDYELELKNLYNSMKDETKKLEYWEFLENTKSKTYRCTVEETIPSETKLERQKEVTKSPKDLLARLSEVCLYKFEGWWSYEFCYGKHIRQFHVEPVSQTEHKVTVEYYLGNFFFIYIFFEEIFFDCFPIITKSLLFLLLLILSGFAPKSVPESTSEEEPSFAYRENYVGGMSR